jgi:hypothetical protein
MFGYQNKFWPHEVETILNQIFHLGNIIDISMVQAQILFPASKK